MICPCCGKPKKPRIPEGLGTALKPAAEFAAVLRKPLSEPTVAANVLRHGTGALNIDASRVAGGEQWPDSGELAGGPSIQCYGDGLNNSGRSGSNPSGRWPANVVHDGSPEVLDAFARSADGMHSAGHARAAIREANGAGMFGIAGGDGHRFGDTGTAARFFYTAKADAAERCDSRHPTVKPAALMEWLVTLVTPPGGRVLDCFCGTGSTLVACDRLGFDAIGIEQDAQTVADAEEKIRRFRARRAIGEVTARYEPIVGQLGLDL